MKIPHRKKASARARGEGFFAAAATASYKPRGSVIGQMTPDSCVAACCRMLLRDDAEDVIETYLRVALDTDRQGSFISNIPTVLSEFGLSATYIYLRDLTIDELKEAVRLAPAMVSVRAGEDWHALLVEGIKDDYVSVRDPLPQGAGSAYRIALMTFINVWALKSTGRGQAAIAMR